MIKIKIISGNCSATLIFKIKFLIMRLNQPYCLDMYDQYLYSELLAYQQYLYDSKH